MDSLGLRITHLVENLERGGLERVVVDLALAQRAQGHAVQVACLFEEGLLAPELAAAGIRVSACRKATGPDPGAVRRLRQLLKAQGTQVLHTHNPAAHYYGALAAIGGPSPTIVNTRHGMGNAPFTLRREILYRASLVGTRAVALVCESARRNFVRHRIVPARKAVVVPNGIRVESFAPRTEATRAAALATLGLDPAGFHVGTVGRLNPVKDHATLLRAMARVRERVPNATLVVVGGGPLRAPLEELARALGLSGCARFLGDRGDVAGLLPGFDVFALSSLTEGYSISLLEACASALPIVATDVGGNAEIVKAGVTGTLVPAARPEELARALVDLAREPALRLSMGEAARSWIAAEGTVAVMARRYGEIYARGRA